MSRRTNNLAICNVIHLTIIKVNKSQKVSAKASSDFVNIMSVEFAGTVTTEQSCGAPRSITGYTTAWE